MNLSLYKNTISDLNPLEHRLIFNTAHWINFDYKNPAITNEVLFIMNNHQDGITRKNIIDYFNQKNSSLLRGFLMTMIWGHGSSENGRPDNRGPWKVSQMVNNLENTINILETAKNYLLLNDLKSAHSAFDKMQRCRVNFFSKYLYFLGRSINMRHYPLIFDARVAKSIGQLTSTNPSLFSIINIQPKQDAVSYFNYVNELHKIAEELNVETENIEYFLFNRSF